MAWDWRFYARSTRVARISDCADTRSLSSSRGVVDQPGDAAVYTRGERVRVFFKLDRDAFVTIFRVDTDGRVRGAVPPRAVEDNFARGGREFEVEGRSSDDAFAIDDYAGVGYLFAVAAADAFTYDAIESGDHWDYRVIADGRVRGDPYVALTDLAQRIVPRGTPTGTTTSSPTTSSSTTATPASCATTATRT